MGLSALDNLVRTGQMKAEPRNDLELTRLMNMAQIRLQDAELPGGSAEGRFLAAYAAAHGAALAALRWHGYRSENRYLVFQSLAHTLAWPAAQWRTLDAAHRKRNLAEYEGFLDVEESGIAELRSLAALLIEDVRKLLAQ